MDEHRFDHLLRTLSMAGTRRGVLGRMAALSLVGVLAALLGEQGIDASRRHRRKVRQRHDPGQDKDNRKGKRRGKGKQSSCTPNCASKECGPDGCGGPCAPGCVDPAQSCTAQGQCVPISCADGVKNGDETGIDCGGSCPPCASGQGCLTDDDCEWPATCNGAPGICETTCTPATAAQICTTAGIDCGQRPDGCGGIVNCGACPAGQTCGGGGTPNVCATCALSATCAAAAAAGLPIRCCNGSCVIGNCCTSADCPATPPTCVNHTCQPCSAVNPTCQGA